MSQQPSQKDAIAAALSAAAQLHRAGNLADARRLFEAVAEADSGHYQALNWLGMVAHQMGDNDYAIDQVSKALLLKPDFPAAHSTLGAILKGLGKTTEAIESYLRAISINPEYFDAHYNLGVAYQSQNMVSEAANQYRKALQINPDHIGALLNLGDVYLKLERFDEAVTALEKAISLAGNVPGPYVNLGNVYQQVGRLDQAAQCYERALKIDPNLAEIFSNLGNIRREQERLNDALDMNIQALQIDPESAIAHNNLGLVYLDMGQLDKALVAFDTSLQIQPDFDEAMNNKGVNLKMLGNLQEAIICHKKAMEINPESPSAPFSLSLALLMDGKLKEGADLYKWRWKNKPHKYKWRQFPQPHWDGSDLTGRRLLVWGEQGIGDEIVFASLYTELLAKAGECIFECEPRLVPLFQRSFPAAQIVAKTNPTDLRVLAMDIDFQCSAGDLLKWLLPSFEGAGSREKCLIADETQVAQLRARYQTPDKPKVVGLGWMTQHPSIKWQYNFATNMFDDLLKIPNIQFVCLQYGDHSRELAEISERTGVTIIQDDEINPLENMDAFAAQVASMDLVISVVNSTAVIAGALGTPVWGVLPKVSEWRWGNEGQTCLWYPSMRVFRASKVGDWSEVSKTMASAFRSWVAER